MEKGRAQAGGRGHINQHNAMYSWLLASFIITLPTVNCTAQADQPIIFEDQLSQYFVSSLLPSHTHSSLPPSTSPLLHPFQPLPPSTSQHCIHSTENREQIKATCGKTNPTVGVGPTELSSK